LASVFLSHSHADNAIAKLLARDLRAAGVKVWIDEAESQVGDSLIHNLGQAIDKTDFLAVLLSGDSVKSEWVLREVAVAMTEEITGRRIRVLPLVVGDCELPPFLRDKIYADFRDTAVYQRELDKVLRRLGATMTGTTTVVFDESYSQSRWFAQPLISAGYATVAASIDADFTVTSNSSGYESIEALASRDILILPMPFGTVVEERHYENIARWVFRGVVW
jgi:TIR domain